VRFLFSFALVIVMPVKASKDPLSLIMPESDEELKASKPKPSPKQNVPPAERQIVIPLTIKIGKDFYSKLPFLIALLCFFTFSLVMFDKSNFKTMDLFDLQRASFTITKLYSVSFIIFVLLFAACIALAMYYSLGLGVVSGVLVTILAFMVSAVMGFAFYPWLLTPFLTFAAVISFCAIVSSISPRFSLPRAFAILSAGMMLFALLAFFVVFYKVAENKDAHVNLLLDSLLARAATGGINIDSNSISSSITKEDFASIVTQDLSRDFLVENYPGYTTLSQAEQDSLVAAFHVKAVDYTYDAFKENSGRIAQGVNTAIISAAGSQGGLLKQQLYAIPEFRLVYNRFALFSGAMAAVIAGFAGFFVQLLALGFLFGLKKTLG
ncbi:MAG TPA: hypothetical protein VJI71_00665, partial [Candidatus Norongarragalinales archaeon]|nr:hypothetical protein [Candidatus Norongarragalinales archaeon]